MLGEILRDHILKYHISRDYILGDHILNVKSEKILIHLLFSFVVL